MLGNERVVCLQIHSDEGATHIPDPLPKSEAGHLSFTAHPTRLEELEEEQYYLLTTCSSTLSIVLLGSGSNKEKESKEKMEEEEEEEEEDKRLMKC